MTQEQADKLTQLRATYNARNGSRWAGYQLSYDMAEQAAAVTFSVDNAHCFRIITCYDGTDARMYSVVR